MIWRAQREKKRKGTYQQWNHTSHSISGTSNSNRKQMREITQYFGRQKHWKLRTITNLQSISRMRSLLLTSLIQVSVQTMVRTLLAVYRSILICSLGWTTIAQWSTQFWMKRKMNQREKHSLTSAYWNLKIKQMAEQLSTITNEVTVHIISHSSCKPLEIDKRILSFANVESK